MQEAMINTELHGRFCRNIRSRRLELGLTQAQLAAKMGVQQPIIARLEAGGSAPTLDTVESVAKSLGLSPEALFLLDPVLA
jgi:predicted transcriptional regulator